MQNLSQSTKKYLPWGNVAQMPLLTYFFLGWVGLGLGISSNNIYMFSNPTQSGQSQTPYEYVLLLDYGVVVIRN